VTVNGGGLRLHLDVEARSRCRSFRLIPGRDETFRRRIEVWSHGVPQNKVIPFPCRGGSAAPVTNQWSWMIFIVECGCPPKPATAKSLVSRTGGPRAQPESLRVESRFLKLRRPAKLGERIDGWRVCWLGGWDKSKLFYRVKVDRVVRAGPSTTR
jgi:hypothetical protein